MGVLKAGDFSASDNGIKFLQDLATELANLKTGLAQLITDFNAHTHGGVSAGAAATAAPTATSATAGSTTDTVADLGPNTQ